MNDESVIIKIDNISSNLNEIWNGIKYDELKNIRDAWDGNLSEEYISKFDNVDKIISNINFKLNELKTLLEKSDDSIENK